MGKAAADSDSILVIGAGIVGVTIAAMLAETGRTVTVVDRKGVAEEASFGNAAALAFSDILPLASPGIMRKAPKWLLDPLGPLAIRPGYLLPILPWLFRFWQASRPQHFAESMKAQAALMALCAAETVPFYERIGLGAMVRHDGSLELYESEAEFRASLPGWRAREAAGIAFEHIGAERIAAFQPGLAPIFKAATFVPGWKTVAEPQRLARGVFDHAARGGARLERADIRRLERHADGSILANAADGSVLSARTVVVAAGAWSHRLLATLGMTRIPLETERGYNTTLPIGAYDLKRQLIFGGHGFVVTPLETGIRVGGAVELGGLDLPPNFARSKAMLAKAKRFMPDLVTSGGTEWMGFRPSLPDSKPVIGRLAAAPNVIAAFGHGHLGLTQSAGTARLVADLVAGRTPPIDLSPYRAERF